MAKNFPKLTDPRKLSTTKHIKYPQKKKKQNKTHLGIPYSDNQKTNTKSWKKLQGRKNISSTEERELQWTSHYASKSRVKYLKYEAPLLPQNSIFIDIIIQNEGEIKAFSLKKKKKTDKFISSRPVLQKNGKKIFKQKINDIGQKPGST